MRRPPARRPRFVAGALIVVAAACADDGAGPVPDPPVVAVAALPCDRPLRSQGAGVVIGDGLVVTAAHVVAGPRREVTAGGRPATVIAVDQRADLAVLRTDLAGRGELGAEPHGSLHAVTPAGRVEVELGRTGVLVVHDATDGARYERAVHTVAPDVPAGTSGSALVDDAGRVVGVVVLANRGDGTTYAATADEVHDVLAGATRSEGEAAHSVCPD